MTGNDRQVKRFSTLTPWSQKWSSVELMAASTTRAETTYRAMRADILAGRLRPGDKLPFAELGERYDASQGVLREGLARLVAEGLVLSEPQVGYRVMPLSIKDLDDLTDARCEIEGLVLRNSVVNGDVGWESEVVAAHHRLERTPDGKGDVDARVSEVWADAHGNFHRALLSACTNDRLKAMALALRASAEVYRQWSEALHEGERDIGDEHRSLMVAALDRDADRAVELLHHHLRTTQLRLVTAALNATPSAAV